MVPETVEVHRVKEDSGGGFCDGSTIRESKFSEKGEDRVLWGSGSGKKKKFKNFGSGGSGDRMDQGGLAWGNKKRNIKEWRMWLIKMAQRR